MALGSVNEATLDQWVEKAQTCKFLAENELKKLCEIVRRCPSVLSVGALMLFAPRGSYSVRAPLRI